MTFAGQLGEPGTAIASIAFIAACQTGSEESLAASTSAGRLRSRGGEASADTARSRASGSLSGEIIGRPHPARGPIGSARSASEKYTV